MSFMSEEFDIALIAAVKSVPMLYDKTDINYKNEHMKKDAWTNIAAMFDYCDLTGDIVANRWLRIRERYTRERKMEIPSDSGAVKEWPLLHHLDFLKKHVPHRAVISNIVGQNSSFSSGPQGCLWALQLTQQDSTDEGLDDPEQTGSSSNNENPPSPASALSQFVARPSKRKRMRETPVRVPSSHNSVGSDIVTTMQAIREASASMQSVLLRQMQKNDVSADEKSLQGLIDILLPMWKTISVSKQGELAAKVIQLFVNECHEGS